MNDTTKSTAALSLPATIVSTLLMFVMLSFFFTFNSSGIYKPAAWILVASCTALFAVMSYTGKIGTYRRVFFVAGALLFFPSFIAILLETRGSMFLTDKDVFLNETPFCHIVLPMTVIPYLLKGVLIFPARLTGHYAAMYSMLVIWLAATLTIGRGWCSWACFYGGWDEGAAALPRTARLRIVDKDKKIRYFNFAILGFVVLGALATFTAVYCTWLCPFKMITEYAEVKDFSGMITFVVFTLTFFGFAIILPILTKKRVQCMSFCPFGAFQSLADKVSPYRVRIDPDKCTKCNACVRACPTLSLHEDDIAAGTGKTLITCTKCGVCIQACPSGAIRYEFAWKGCRSDGGPLARWSAKLSEGTGLARVLGKILAVVDELASPKALMPFSGFMFGSVLMGGFATGTIGRFLNLIVNGSFLMP